MIKSALIVPYSKDGSSEIENGIKNLWPAKNKAIKIFSDFNVSQYKFKVASTQKINELNITINKFELIPLTLIDGSDGSDGIYRYQSKDFGARSFLGFNLGLLELSLSTGENDYALTTLNNKQGLLGNEEIGYIYESVASSGFFNLYIAQYLRANASSKQIELDNENKHFWVRIAIANELLREAGNFLKGELDFTNRVHSSSQVKKYSKDSIIEDRDIHWLMENPNEMFISEFGDIPHLGLKYDVDFISQSITSIDYDTYENRLIISCLYSIKSSLEELAINHSDVRYFPHHSLSNILEKQTA